MQLIDHEEEYIDEDKYTTVTVEAVGISKEGFSKADDDGDGNEGDEGKFNEKSPTHATLQKKSVTNNGNQRSKSKDGEQKGRQKKKRKKFRYESKADRKLTRTKQRQKKSKMAEVRRAKG